MTNKTFIIDAMGGSPILEHGKVLEPYQRITQAAREFQDRYPFTDIYLVGDVELLREGAETFAKVMHVPYWYNAQGRIVDREGKEHPDCRKQTSAHQLFTLQLDNACYFSIGETRRTMSHASAELGRIKAGEDEVMPGICISLPYGNERRYLTDGGFTHYPDDALTFMRQLHHWALMTLAYTKKEGHQNQTLRLLSTGEGDEKKGGRIRIAAHTFLRETGLQYEGIVEPPNPLKAQGKDGDIVLSDGFSANLVIKTMAGMVEYLRKSLKNPDQSHLRKCLGYLHSLAGGYDEFNKAFNPDTAVGIVLGLEGLVAKGHGISTTIGIFNTLDYLMQKTAVIRDLEEALAVHPFPEETARDILKHT